MGGLAGAGIARAGFGVLVQQPKLTLPLLGAVPGLGEKWMLTIIFIALAPLMGMVLGLALMVAASWLLKDRAPRTVDKWFRKLQLLSAAAYSLGHGGNDAQKTMGIIAGALLAGGLLSPQEFAKGWGPYKWYIILGANGAIALGTYFGGWRIVHTMGAKITKLKPVGGFCAETAGAITLFMASSLGIPVSTTHTITGAIVGVGSTQRISAVRWGVAGRIVWAWILTIPASALVAALVFWIIRLFNPGA
jgi:PiT family inorganic phosphate transporter